MDSGINSLAAVEFRNRLASEVPQAQLPNTLIFDYPTASAIAQYAVTRMGASTGPSQAHVVELGESGVGRSLADAPLAISGVANNFPAGGASANAYWACIAAGTGGAVEVPFTRWEISEVHDDNPDAQGKMYPRHGAFIEGAELFDASFFDVSAPERRAMDPQQRLLLENSLDALLDAGYEKPQLMGSNVAVLVGQAKQ
jgi:hypothetical protein